MNLFDIDKEKTAFLLSFADEKDLEVSSVILALLSNDFTNEFYIAKQIICDIMNNKPYEYILSYDKHMDFYSQDVRPIAGVISNKHLHNLCVRLNKTLKANDTIFNGYKEIKTRKKNGVIMEYVCISKFLSGGTGFQENTSMSCYRYSLIFYWLSYKAHLWALDEDSLLLPCNDRILKVAIENDLMKKVYGFQQRNAIKLTNIAKEKYGESFYMFYKLYEDLIDYGCSELC